MQTTLTIENPLANELKKRAQNLSLDYRLKPASLGASLVGINLDKALHLADALEACYMNNLANISNTHLPDHLNHAA